MPNPVSDPTRATAAPDLWVDVLAVVSCNRCGDVARVDTEYDAILEADAHRKWHEETDDLPEGLR